MPVAVHQIIDSLAPGAAVSNVALEVQRVLLKSGFLAGIYAQSREHGIVQPRRAIGHAERTLWIYHFSISSPLTAWAEERAAHDLVILWYHNLTPSAYFAASDPFLAARLIAGQGELSRLAPRCVGAIADSEFNAADLRACGYQDIQVVPPVFLGERYRLPPTAALLAQYQDGRPSWLFVGRVVPNKGQSELITAFQAYKRLEPAARLLLVGSEGASHTYRRWLENQIAFCGLGADVQLVGQVSQEDMNAYYRLSSCFVSMSEHEGFGVPLVESLYYDLPVIAYAIPAVSETLGEAGIQLTERHPYLIAEIAHLVQSDAALREGVLRRQRLRLAEFAYERVAGRLLAAVQRFI